MADHGGRRVNEDDSKAVPGDRLTRVGTATMQSLKGSMPDWKMQAGYFPFRFAPFPTFR